jgi:lipopolysaccharide export system ATP-binding protein
MGYLPQEISIFRKLTTEKNIIAILEMLPKSRTLGRPLTRSERYERTEAAITRFGLTRVRKSLATSLSGGEKRRLEIARCLVCEPLLILLDEPFTGIDPITIGEIRQIIVELRNEGIGILLTDHNVHEALKITTRSYLIKDGKVRTQGTPGQIVRDQIAITEYLGAGFSDNRYGAIDDVRQPPPIPTFSPITSVKAGAAPKPVEEAKTLQFAEPTPKVSAAQLILEQEKIQQLIDGLKSNDRTKVAEALVKKGMAAVTPLLAALERRDAELRQYAVEVLRAILQHPISFDAFAPEAERKHQLAALRDLFERKAG